jgi:glycosyltransferase involved in cell wall biosynthesis
LFAGAMAMGKVTVAGNNPGYSSVLTGKGALSLVNPKDISEFARRIMLMMDDADLRLLWQTWAKDTIKAYDASRIADQYLETYSQALAMPIRKIA